MHETWLERWKNGRTGWHEPDGNLRLQNHWGVSGRRVLVPLCGKSVDMLWLEEQGNAVFGVELSGIAIQAFFAEARLDYEEFHGNRHRFVALERDITIVCGDYFDVADERFDACYDRGAFAALPAPVRARYAEHTNSLLSDEAYHLLITLEYDQSLVEGPPFNITEDEVAGYWPGLERVEVVNDIDNAPPKFHDAGVIEMLEVCWRTRTTMEPG